jgi:hypothetical protein
LSTLIHDVDAFPLQDDETTFPFDPISVFYHECNPEDAKKAAARLKVHSAATIMEKTRSAAWRRIPVSYFICENGRSLAVETQEGMTEMIKAQGLGIEVERIASDHSPHIGKSEVVAGFIDRAARRFAAVYGIGEM